MGKIKRKLHLVPEAYLEVTNAVEPHPNLYISTKHVNGDFLRDLPFNKTLGIGKHQKIVEVSINLSGMYGRNAHCYYIGKGIIEGWPEMEEPRGLQDFCMIKCKRFGHVLMAGTAYTLGMSFGRI